MAGSDDKEVRKGVLSRTGALLRRRPEVLVVNDYHIGDIDSEKTVYVATGAAIAGNVTAPRIEIAGLVYGFVACDKLLVDDEGQIWGDAYTVSLQLKQGGKINGWVCTLDQGTVELLRAGELTLKDLPTERRGSIPLALRSFLKDRTNEFGQLDANDSAGRVLVWRQLQSEAATALLARIELENAFEQRIDEMAREAVHGSAALLGELVQTKGELAVLQGRMEQMQKVVQLHDEMARTPSESVPDRERMSVSKNREVRTDDNLVERLNELQRKCEVYENELRGLRQKVEIQNSFLTKFQSALNQRQEELKLARAVEERQAGQLAKIKEQAGARIRKLTSELALAQEQLEELKAGLKEPGSTEQ